MEKELHQSATVIGRLYYIYKLLFAPYSYGRAVISRKI
jgi:hypothetical protein